MKRGSILIALAALLFTSIAPAFSAWYGYGPYGGYYGHRGGVVVNPGYGYGYGWRNPNWNWRANNWRMYHRPYYGYWGARRWY